MFSLICVWINGWVNNGEAGDLRRYRAHYDFTVMEVSNVSNLKNIGYVMITALDCIALACAYQCFFLHNVIYASVNYAIIGSENDLSPVRRRAIV